MNRRAFLAKKRHLDGAMNMHDTLVGNGPKRMLPRRVHRDGTIEISAGMSHFRNPAVALADAINGALDPVRAPSAVRVYTDEEKANLANERGCSVSPPTMRQKALRSEWWAQWAIYPKGGKCSRCGVAITKGNRIFRIENRWLCCPTPSERVACELAVRRAKKES